MFQICVSCLSTELKLVEFSEPGIFNYSTLLLSEDKDVLYVGAREAIFELRMTNVSIKNNKVQKGFIISKGFNFKVCLLIIVLFE